VIRFLLADWPGNRMEADWEFEVGGDAPVIEAPWPGFVDLRLHPERAWQLSEALTARIGRGSGKAECGCLAGLDLEMRLLAGG
jgi:hypothetical protein